MKNFKFIPTICWLSCLVLFQNAQLFQKDPIGSFTYKIGTDTKTASLKSLSVKFTNATTGNPGKEKTTTSVGLTAYDYENNIGIRFSIREDKVVSELSGNYPLGFQSGFGEGESLRSASVMIVDTKDAGNTLQSITGGICEITVSGTKVYMTIKNAKVRGQDKELPFEFSLKTDQAKIKLPS